MEKIKRLKELGGYFRKSNEEYGLWGGDEDG